MVAHQRSRRGMAGRHGCPACAWTACRPGASASPRRFTLVDDEHDSYGKDDISVTRVVTDPELDIAVLKARADLQVMPWKIGHSAGIRERNLVEVRGFPLGAFRATNIGKVISAHDHDDYADWDHDDFIVDALLSRGNSGSPVLGISCATGEYELVGVYHAGYSEGTALNAVIGIDQVRDLMATLKRTPRRREESGCDGRRGRAARCYRGPRRRRRCLLPVRQPGRAGRTGPAATRFSGRCSPRSSRRSGSPRWSWRTLPASDSTSFRIAGPDLARLDARPQGVRSVGAGCRRPGARSSARSRGSAPIWPPSSPTGPPRTPASRDRRTVSCAGWRRRWAGPPRLAEICSRRSQISQTKALPSPAIEVCDSRRWAAPNSRRRSRRRLRGRPSRVYPALRHRPRYRPDRAAMHTGSETRNLRASPDCHVPDESAHVLELVRRFGSGADVVPGARARLPVLLSGQGSVRRVHRHRSGLGRRRSAAGGGSSLRGGSRRRSSTPRAQRIGAPASSRPRIASSVGSRCDRC